MSNSPRCRSRSASSPTTCWGDTIQKRIWIKSGIVEELDQRQLQLLELVHAKIKYYYQNLHLTRSCYQYPLSISRLKKLCNRSGSAVTMAVKYLANTIPYGSNREPLIYYDRIKSQKNPSLRPYRIFLRTNDRTNHHHQHF